MNRAIFWFFWLVLAGGATLLALAINDYGSAQDAAGLNSVHTAGMVDGYALCKGEHQ